MESQNELLAFMDRGEMASCQNRWTFEAAWEVANKGERMFYVFYSRLYKTRGFHEKI
jgi:hypothetical protein